jgi:hypothetical protein
VRREPDLWSVPPVSEALMRNAEAVFGATAHLPIQFWISSMFFTGASDQDLTILTHGEFPKTMIPRKTHPIYSLVKLPDGVGVTVCPCTSRRPFGRGVFRYIRKGCRLRYTQHTMDRDSFLVEKVRFNIPRSVAYELRFRGEVPDGCLKLWNEARSK